MIQGPLALKLLDGEVLPGDTLAVDADLKKVEMKFELETAKTAKK